MADTFNSIGCPSFNPKKLVELSIPKKNRAIQTLLFAPAEKPTPTVTENKISEKSYASLMLYDKLVPTAVSMPNIRPAKELALFTRLTIEEDTIDYKFNQKLLYDCMMFYYMYVRAMIIKAIANRDTNHLYLEKEHKERNSNWVASRTLRSVYNQMKIVFGFLCRHHNIRNFLEVASLHDCSEKKHMESIARLALSSPTTIMNEFFVFSDARRPRYVANSAGQWQLDNEINEHGTKTFRKNMSYSDLLNTRVFDTDFKSRIRHGIDTRYTYQQVMGKSAGPAEGEYVKEVDPARGRVATPLSWSDTAKVMLGIDTTDERDDTEEAEGGQKQTPYTHLSNILYLFKKPIDNYNDVMLKCATPPGKVILIDAYLEKSRRAIRKIKDNIESLALALSAVAQSADGDFNFPPVSIDPLAKSVSYPTFYACVARVLTHPPN